MQQPDKLPLDVLGYITDILGTDTLRSKQRRKKDRQYSVDTLKMLSLTCKFMVPVCRRHLFAIIRFPFHPRNSERLEGLSEFLLAHPTITTHYLKRLYLKIDPYNPFSISDYDFLQKISDSSSLVFVDLSTIHLCNWNRTHLRYYEPPEKTKSVILSLIQVLTLRGLTLRDIENFPAAALSLCSGLKELEFDSISNLAPPSANDAMQRPTITTLVSLTLHSGQ